jgi:hypothetical protein
LRALWRRRGRLRRRGFEVWGLGFGWLRGKVGVHDLRDARYYILCICLWDSPGLSLERGQWQGYARLGGLTGNGTTVHLTATDGVYHSTARGAETTTATGGSVWVSPGCGDGGGRAGIQWMYDHTRSLGCHAVGGQRNTQTMGMALGKGRGTRRRWETHGTTTSWLFFCDLDSAF